MPKNKLSCPSNVKDCGPGLRERLRDRINEGIEKRAVKRIEKTIKKEEKNYRAPLKAAVGDSKPTKVAINYNEVKKGGMKGRLNPYSA